MGITPIEYTGIHMAAAPYEDLAALLHVPYDTKTLYKVPEVEALALKQPVEEGELYTNKHRDLRVTLFRDSFSIMWMPYMNDTFGRVHYIWRYEISADDLKNMKQNTDIIILQQVERLAHQLKDYKFPKE